MRYKIEYNFRHGWDDSSWHDDGQEMHTYASREEAQKDIDDIVAATLEAYDRGDMEEPYRAKDYRIVEAN
jgi:hypothetical protein